MKNFTKILYSLVLLITTHVSLAQVPKLSSLPGAAATIYFDFDGHTVQSAVWQGGQAFTCAASGLSPNQITEIFNRVSEDFRPFDVNITTDSTQFLAAAPDMRIRMIVTPTSAWYTNVGGVSFVGSFNWGDDTPGFIFPDRLSYSAKYIAECCSHETGHTLGLSHQSRYDDNCVLTQTYSMGEGSGEISWAPVMGNSYYKNMTGWNDGPTPYGCSNTQDNLTIITNANGFTYRADDYNDALDNNTYNLGNNDFSVNGIIATTGDKDAFQFTITQSAAFHLLAKPFGIDAMNNGANLDIKLELYNADKILIRTYNPQETMSVTVDTTLNSGKYFLIISGTGNSYVSDYGSLGSYTITASRGALPIHDISLYGRQVNNIHQLNWNIIADEAIETQSVEVSRDGIYFKSIGIVNGTSRTFQYHPYDAGVLYYRIKVTSVINQSMYSNVISLKATDNKENNFEVSTLIHQEISVNAPAAFAYRLWDATGKLITTGTGTKGMNRKNTGNLPSGIYIIELISNNHKQTERLLKQ